MATYFDKKHDFIIREVPKCGSTTIRSWIYYSQVNNLQLVRAPGYEEFYYEDDKIYQHISQNGYVMDVFSEYEGESICIKRDPVKRFISCYADKIVREKWLNVSLSDFIDNFEKYVDVNAKHKQHHTEYGFIWYHFAPQVNQLGPSRDNYTHVFDIKELSTTAKEYLEDKWKIQLPELHCRNNKRYTFRLSPKQIAKVEEIYSVDYQAGWC